MFGWKTKNKAPYHRVAEMNAAYAGGLEALTHGLIAGTCVASNLGWRAVDALTVGDKVLTFDNGMQQITQIRRQMVWLDAPDTAEKAWPVVVPAGALGNRTELHLLADQGVMIESDAASDMNGDPFAVIPAAALVGVRGIARCAPAVCMELIILEFAQPEVIFVEGGAMLHCPRTTVALDSFIEGDAELYDVLSARDAEFLVSCLRVEDEMLANASWLETEMCAA